MKLIKKLLKNSIKIKVTKDCNEYPIILVIYLVSIPIVEEAFRKNGRDPGILMKIGILLTFFRVKILTIRHDH